MLNAARLPVIIITAHWLLVYTADNRTRTSRPPRARNRRELRSPNHDTDIISASWRKILEIPCAADTVRRFVAFSNLREHVREIGAGLIRGAGREKDGDARTSTIRYRKSTPRPARRPT